jgi:hypothetical protein
LKRKVETGEKSHEYEIIELQVRARRTEGASVRQGNLP